MTIKGFLTVLGVIAILYSIGIYAEKHTVKYTMTGVCEDKITSQDRDGRHIYYTILVRLENGEVIEKEVEPSAYVTYKKGGQYVFSFSKINW